MTKCILRVQLVFSVLIIRFQRKFRVGRAYALGRPFPFGFVVFVFRSRFVCIRRGHRGRKYCRSRHHGWNSAATLHFHGISQTLTREPGHVIVGIYTIPGSRERCPLRDTQETARCLVLVAHYRARLHSPESVSIFFYSMKTAPTTFRSRIV